VTGVQTCALPISIWLEQLGYEPTEAYILYDEIQLVDGWESWVNHLCKKRELKVVVTGSNSRMLSSELASLLTGRNLKLHLTPLSFREIVETRLQVTEELAIEQVSRLHAQFNDYFLYGAFPQVFVDQNVALLPEYFRDIITRDILIRKGIRRPATIMDLGVLLASENSRIFNLERSSQLLELSKAQYLKNYIEYVKETFLFDEIRAYNRSARKKLRSHPKFYCVDHGMARSISRIVGGIDGALFETVVFHELKRKFPAAEIYYWKSEGLSEVDFVVVEGRLPIAAVQVAESINDTVTRARELNGLLSAYRELGIRDLVVITRREREDVELIPQVRCRIEPFVTWCLRGEE
jgi:predicted AAA+ superfamily ATPase